MLSVLLAMTKDDDDKVKITQLYEAYYRLALKIANQILHDRMRAEDTVQEAFILIINNLQNVHEIKCPKTRAYIVTIVRNLSINVYKKENRHNNTDLDELDYAAIEPDFMPDTVNKVLVKTVFAELTPKNRDILLLKYWNGCTSNDIAKALGISEETARKRISRAMEKAGEIFKRMGATAND